MGPSLVRRVDNFSTYTAMKLNLDSIKPGDEITFVRIKAGKWNASGIRVVSGYDEKIKRWRYTNPSGKTHGAFPADGGCRDFMSDYYVSANPAHIRKAKANAARAARDLKRAESRMEKIHNQFKQELFSLLEKYSAEIGAEQLSGDDQGVEVGVYVSLNASANGCAGARNTEMKIP